MEPRLANTWRLTVNEKKFIETALQSDLRIDGRRPFEYRKISIKFGREDGSTEVQLGQTHVMGFVTAQLVQPYKDRPNEGTLSIFTEFSPMADPSFEPGRPGEAAVELGRVIDRGLRESRAVDMESLCVISGKSVWSVRVDLHILDNGGNLIDGANIAALAALMTFRRPECSLGGEDGQEVIVHPPEVESYNTERALRKIKRHSNSVSLDVCDADVDVVSERSKLIPGKSIADQSMDIEGETKSSKQGQTSRIDGDAKNFIGGPSSWDPYAGGVHLDSLKASLASRGTSTPSRKEKYSRGENMSCEADPVEPPEDNSLASSPIEAAKTPLGTNGEKTLKDAVKSKNKRKKKASSAGGS